MTSNTFKSAWPNHPRRINVREIEDGVNVRISDPQWEDKKGITLAPSDAPALALAILEAAGVAESSDAGVAAQYLRAHMAEQERITAEAKEQAELEAEALELFKTLMGVKGYENFTWPEVASKDEWLAVARKAREMRAEK